MPWKNQTCPKKRGRTGMLGIPLDRISRVSEIELALLVSKLHSFLVVHPGLWSLRTISKCLHLPGTRVVLNGLEAGVLPASEVWPFHISLSAYIFKILFYFHGGQEEQAPQMLRYFASVKRAPVINYSHALSSHAVNKTIHLIESFQSCFFVMLISLWLLVVLWLLWSLLLSWRRGVPLQFCRKFVRTNERCVVGSALALRRALGKILLFFFSSQSFNSFLMSLCCLFSHLKTFCLLWPRRASLDVFPLLHAFSSVTCVQDNKADIISTEAQNLCWLPYSDYLINAYNIDSPSFVNPQIFIIW